MSTIKEYLEGKILIHPSSGLEYNIVQVYDKGLKRFRLKDERGIEIFVSANDILDYTFLDDKSTN